ncbi:MAG: MlaD family protein [Rhodococcus sp. (in: high G+C Gram-positive bacteria)]|uniref:MCE family protein n=1 Tax=Rhodococcus sp. TaxID=1831 RepID=UPI003BB2185D
MILSRFVKVQLAIFTVLTVIGVSVVSLGYIQFQTFLGIGKDNITLRLPAVGGLYKFSNVTYRGVTVGKVTALDLTSDGVDVTLSLDDSAKIPADLEAYVRSVSAVGEQYVDLRPRTDNGPYLEDGSVIDSEVTLPREVGPLLDQVSNLVSSIPQDKTKILVGEAFTAFNGSGDDFGALLDATETLVSGANEASDQMKQLVQQAGPLLDTQIESADKIAEWASSLAGITGQIRQNDPHVRTVLQQGPGLTDQINGLLREVEPTVPVLLANLTTVEQVLVTYNPSLEQILVLLPGLIEAVIAYGPGYSEGGLTPASFRMQSDAEPSCTVGFLPVGERRDPQDVSEIDTPDGLYCKLPQDSPISVRGARNYPCMGVPGKRAPTVEMCRGDEDFRPVATGQPPIGTNPPDPSLSEQGVVPDPYPSPNQFPPGDFQAPQIPVARYDPNTGRYVGPDGQTYTQGNVVPGDAPASFESLMPR